MIKGIKMDPEMAAELKALRILKKEHEKSKTALDPLKKASALAAARKAKPSSTTGKLKARTRS